MFSVSDNHKTFQKQLNHISPFQSIEFAIATQSVVDSILEAKLCQNKDNSNMSHSHKTYSFCLQGLTFSLGQNSNNIHKYISLFWPSYKSSHHCMQWYNQVVN